MGLFDVLTYIDINNEGLFMRLFLLFIMYAMAGWLVEVSDYIIEDHKLVNRGFMVGPYCPIHGIGCILCIFLLGNVTSNPFFTFILAVIIVSVLEYFTSYVMEKLFNARWWDYSNCKFNINGRIKLLNCILFGLGAMLVIYVINPIFMGFVNGLSYTTLCILFAMFFSIFILDFVVSFKIISGFKNASYTIKDNTEEISKKVRQKIGSMSLLGKRLVSAFPNVKIKFRRVKIGKR